MELDTFKAAKSSRKNAFLAAAGPRVAERSALARYFHRDRGSESLAPTRCFE